jgi:hypothetical protein
MKKYSIEIKWGILFMVMTLLWMLIEKGSGLHSIHIETHALYSNFFAVFAIALYVVALLDKRKNYYFGKMNYVQGFMSGVVITVVATVLSPLTQYIALVLISPEYFPNIIQYTTTHNIMTPEAAELQFNLQNYIIQGFIGSLIMGLVTAAIVAVFTRRK